MTGRTSADDGVPGEHARAGGHERAGEHGEDRRHEASGDHAELLGEVRRLLGDLAERAQSYLGGLAYTANGWPRGAGEDTNCDWCPLCAVIGLVRGDRPELAEQLSEHAVALLTKIREVLGEAAGPAASGAEETGATSADLAAGKSARSRTDEVAAESPVEPVSSADPAAERQKVQPIEVRRVRGRVPGRGSDDESPTGQRTATGGQGDTGEQRQPRLNSEADDC